MEAAFPTQQPLRLHVERMTQLYEFARIEPRAPALPAHDLCLTVARQLGKLAAIHVGLSHRTRQALADPLLLGSVILLRHRRASLCQTVTYTKMLGDGRLCALGSRWTSKTPSIRQRSRLAELHPASARRPSSEPI